MRSSITQDKEPFTPASNVKVVQATVSFKKRRNDSTKKSPQSEASLKEFGKASKFEWTQPIPKEKEQDGLMVVETTHRFYKTSNPEQTGQMVEMNNLKEKMKGFIDSYQKKMKAQQKTIDQLQQDKEQL